MVPYYGRHGCKQFIRGKPIRYGYKLWTGCTSKGYVIWVEPYQGAKSEIKPCYKELGLGPSVILQYTDIINSIQSFPYHIFCDNFFTTIPLLSEMTRRNLKITGTIRENRTSKCPLANKSQFKKKSRGFIQYQTNEENTVVVKWHDNNVVTLASNALPVHPTHSVSRYSLKEKKKIKVDQPHNIFTYNKYMGGVDRADQNISLYRIGLRGKKWEQNGKLDHLRFRRRIVMTILEGNQRKFAKRSKLSQSHNYKALRGDNCVQIETKGTIMTAVYISPNISDREYQKAIDKTFETATKNNGRRLSIMAGDINAKSAISMVF
ncbi:piggyBac transposable element-derived protein 3-like [Diorhabda sublineata]|uniref:piggyBac transposable element-derived protein 3-like n=1 Tax=Diorhabda sublineata TaxID=1163346 RepID=UPI0024E089EC|nr:piggyBac transposable element-derived protein 3-like [Diorhabda sublineata]